MDKLSLPSQGRLMPWRIPYTLHACSLAFCMLLSHPIAVGEESIVQRELERRVQNASQAFELLSSGDEAYKASDYKTATESYAQAFSLLPGGILSHELRSAAADRYATATTEYCRRLAKNGAYDQARILLDQVLKPEVDVITQKYKDDSVKRQQETMTLYSKAGANPMSGCLPALIQLPVFYALFSFFPVAFALRQKSFLWADDLSSYDSVLELGFNIPFYGDHISLFPILASVAIFFYTMMTAGQQSAPQQPGMPNMKVIMYIMPFMMLVFFNNYASGLSLYYFVSNVLTIILMLVIKNFIVDDEKILAKIEENKKKPQKKGGFSARLQQAMEQAEQQKKARGKR